MNFTKLKNLQNSYTVEISDREIILEIKKEIGYTKRRKKWETKTMLCRRNVMNQKLKIAAIACLAGIAVLSTGFSAMTLIRVKQLEENVSAVHSSVTNIDSDINSTLNSAVTTITQTAEKSASIVSDYKVIWGECSQKDQTMQVKIRIMPKTYNEETQVRVRYSGHSAKGQGYDMVFDTEGFDELAAEAQRVESGVYEAELTIPLVDYISLNAEIQNGDSIQQEKLKDQYSAWGLHLLHPQMSGGFEQYSVTSNDKMSIDYTAFAQVDLMTSYDAGGVSNDPEMVGGTVSIYLNDEELETRDLGAQEVEVESDEAEKTVLEDGSILKVWSGDNSSHPTSWTGQIKNLKEGDVISFVIRIQDENGFTYEKEVERTVYTVKDGWIKGTNDSSCSQEIIVK